MSEHIYSALVIYMGVAKGRIFLAEFTCESDLFHVSCWHYMLAW